MALLASFRHAHARGFRNHHSVRTRLQVLAPWQWDFPAQCLYYLLQRCCTEIFWIMKDMYPVCTGAYALEHGLGLAWTREP